MLVTLGLCARFPKEAGISGGAPPFAPADSHPPFQSWPFLTWGFTGRCVALAILFAAPLPLISQQPAPAANARAERVQDLPPRVAQAQRFLARRAVDPARGVLPRMARRANALPVKPQTTAATATWQPLGPSAVLTPNYGLVTGRGSTIGLAPSDPT